MLQYRNTPLGYSPAQMLFGRRLKATLPCSPGKQGFKAETMDYRKKYGVPFSEYWNHILAGREIGASKKLFSSQERYDEHKRPLTPLSVGTVSQYRKGKELSR